jgi:MoxR-like ATPase
LPPHQIEETVKNVQEPAERVVANVERVIVGKHLEVRMALVALMCEGHILIEDVPGVGKTMLAKAISRSVGCTFRRIQFTPDLLPSDVTGLSIFNQKTQEFEFRPGPIMAQVVLADEINRATPKTQSALLECMEERQATIDGVTYPMPSPFLVIATQNPIEYEGTFALPEAQLDRFMLRLRIGYPKPMEEIVILDEQKRIHPIDAVHQVLDVDELRQMQTAIKEVYVDQAVAEYIVRLVTATREHADVYLGASPRGSLNLYRSAQAFAAMEGRDYVIPDDVKSLAVAVLAHRLIVKSQASLREVDPDRIVREILSSVPVTTGAATSAATPATTATPTTTPSA